MSDLDIRTKNILTAIESTLTATQKNLTADTHQAIVSTLSKAMDNVVVSYKKYQEGTMTSQKYGKVLIKLAELTIMAVRKLPG
jgi:ATP-dependent helicase/DNAse subunit B